MTETRKTLAGTTGGLSGLSAIGPIGRKFDYGLIVIGSGAAGTAAALIARRNAPKTKIAIIEAGAWGGSTLCARDVPFMAGMTFAHNYARALEAVKMGVSSGNLRYNLANSLQWRAGVVRKTGAGSKKVFEDAEIECVKGFAHFLDPYTIAVGTRKISAPRFILATGGRIDMQSITGTDEVECLTPEVAMRLPRLPRAVTIVGGGSTGCELAGYFAELGVQVVIVEQTERILPREDPEVSEVMTQYFVKRLGVKIVTRARVTGVERDEKSKKVVFEQMMKKKSVRTETVVLANGTVAVADYGLENAKVRYTRGGILVDRGLATSSKHIWAAGDAIGGGESSVEKAGYEGTIAAANAVKHAKNLINYSGFMRVTNTYPQVAKVGLNEVDCAVAKMRGVKKGVVMLGEIGVAKVCGFDAGLVKILTDRQGVILGGTVVAPEASLIAQELALAVKQGLRAVELAAVPHAGYGWGEAVQEALRRIR